MGLDEKINSIIKLLDQLLEDRSVPRNIKEGIEKAKKSLLDKSREVVVRIDAAIQSLEEVSDDPNIPMFARTQIWNAITLLEMLESEVR